MLKNVMIVGYGPHAQKNHTPALLDARAHGKVGTIVAIDIAAAREQIASFTELLGGGIRTVYVDDFDAELRELPQAVVQVLDGVVEAERIDGVIVATEPSFHVAYARWAIRRGISVLIDKPLSIHANSSIDPAAAAAIHEDFEALATLYIQERSIHPDLFVGVHTQRRYHPAFKLMRSLITEVAGDTNCPVTSVQSYHSDGQWRMPDELIDITYHSFERGYGKAAHSGYHFFDIVPWLIEAGETDEKRLDQVEVFANVTRPADLLTQISVSDYQRLFPEFPRVQRYSADILTRATAEFGEVDAFISAAFKSRGRTVTLASINLLHNGISQRGSEQPNTSDLYKGNGRVRHETHIISQGPFQALHLQAFQSLDKSVSESGNGGVSVRDHIVLQVFRNNHFKREWKKTEVFDYDGILANDEDMRKESLQAVSRRKTVDEFLLYLNGRRSREHMASELTTHRRGSVLMAGVYLSAARQWTGETATAVLDFHREFPVVAESGADLSASFIRA
ncbi:Gfo/Idh/MocA family oxidoreductase [Nocardia sp. NPDC005978]|uniref:Gfo/Idh/MocA family oxidoreductase n=1 Tax=Nocardia sp. NPDC005978 TaxID=3156725 RepID=UPI0033BA7B75